MSSASDRFVRARRALREGQSAHLSAPPASLPETWGSAYRSQALLRALEPELTVPLYIARDWARNAAARAIDHPSEGPTLATVHAARGLDSLLALCGWYADLQKYLPGSPLPSETDTLGPFDTHPQALRAARAALGHGWDSFTLRLVHDVQEVLTTVV